MLFDAATEAGTVDKSVLDYISSLRSIIDAYEKRDDHLRMRTEAVGFQPKQAWAAWESAGAENSSHDTASAALPPANAVLGVRLLQRLDKLQRENDELGALLTSGARINADAAAGTAETEELRKEVHDCHQLIEAIDKALVEAEGRASASERALEAACRTNSTAMVPAKPGATSTKAAGAVAAATGSAQEAKKPSPKPTNASAARRGSKPVISSSSPNAGAGGKVAYQQRNSKPNQPTPKSGGGSGSSRTTRNDKSAAQTADGKTGKTPSPSAVTKGK
uniref:Uncharacterized protein n=1 Tax=Kalmanozyma brasiliensis (strain GHG001) TaxID=1365824 RepID=V5EW52_KALBG